MLTANDLKNGMVIVFEGDPYQILESQHSHIARGSSNIQVRLKNIKTDSVINRSFKSSDKFKEAEIEREKIEYLYNHRGEYWFSSFGNRSKRFALKEEFLGDEKYFLKPNTEFEAVKFKNEVINISIPIKMNFKVVSAPPNIRGNTAQGGSKIVVLETGAKISTPLFIEEGDIIRVNTEKEEYVERVEKG
jgi:elongation factor P